MISALMEAVPSKTTMRMILFGMTEAKKAISIIVRTVVCLLYSRGNRSLTMRIVPDSQKIVAGFVDTKTSYQENSKTD